MARNCMLTFTIIFLLTACSGGGGGSSLNIGDGTLPSYISTPLIESSGQTVIGDTAIYKIPDDSTRSDYLYSVIYFGRGEHDMFIINNDAGLVKFYTPYGDSTYFSDLEFATTGDSDFREEDNYHTALKINGNIYDKVYFGGKINGFDHAEFGIWKQNILTADMTQDRRFDNTFYYGEESKLALPTAGIGTMTFTGNALGKDYDYESEVKKDVDVFGSASLTVDRANLSGAILDLSFDNFYHISFKNVDVTTYNSPSTGTTIEVPNQLISFSDNNNTTGIDFGSPGGLYGTLEMSMFGNIPVEPTEVVGSFQAGIAAKEKGIVGAFGVRRNP